MLGSKCDSQTELHGARLFLSGGFAEQSAGQVGCGLGEIDAIEEIENLAADFERCAFSANKPGNMDSLDAVQVYVRKSGTFERIAAQIAFLPFRGQGELAARENAFDEIAARSREGVAECRSIRRVVVEAVGVVVTRRIRSAGVDGKWEAALQNGDGRKPPAAEGVFENARLERNRNFPDRIQGQPLVYVVVGAAPLPIDVGSIENIAPVGGAVVVAAIGIGRPTCGEESAGGPTMGEPSSGRKREDVGLVPSD